MEVMKKILCPCDFSTPALRGIEYAADLCQKINGNITLCHVQPSVWPEAIFLEPVVEESIESAEEKLKVIADGLSEKFGIKTQLLNPRTTHTVEQTIGNLSEEFDLNSNPHRYRKIQFQEFEYPIELLSLPGK